MPTNAGAEVNDFTPHKTSTSTGRFRFPTQVLLNNYFNTLQRTKVPFRQKILENFLKSIVARMRHKSVPLLYTEAILFPNVFWKQESDGASVGAQSSFLLQPNTLNQQLAFASIQTTFGL